MIRTKASYSPADFSPQERPEKESPLDSESEPGRWFIFGEECSFCNGTGKLVKPGGPDCPQCDGTGVNDAYLRGGIENKTEMGCKEPMRLGQ